MFDEMITHANRATSTRAEGSVFSESRAEPQIRTVQVYYRSSHVAETAPFRTPPLDLDKNEHASRRISTPPVTMGLFRSSRAAPFEVLM